jgi:hypothetical protein
VKITFEELRGEATRERLAAARAISSDGYQLAFPAGLLGGLDCTYLVRLDAAPPHGPAKITLRTATGVDLATMDLTYKPVRCAAGVVYLPDQVTTTSRMSDNRLMLSATIRATVMEVDRPIPAETFTLDYQTARRVIDIDIPAAQRHKSLATRPAVGLSTPATPTTTAPPTTTGPANSGGNTAVMSPGIALGGDEGQRSPLRLILGLAGIGAAAAAGVLVYYKNFAAGRGR